MGCSWSAMETDERPDAGLEISEDGVPLRRVRMSIADLWK